MLSFGGSFWSSYRQQNSASIEELLNNETTTVEKILEDDDCLQEFKNLNEKLINYFNQDRLKKLVDLITVMPPEDATHNRGHNEIFNCEINQILERFFEEKKPEESKEEEEEEEEEDRKDGDDATASTDIPKLQDQEDEEEEEEESQKEKEKKEPEEEAPTDKAEPEGEEKAEESKKQEAPIKEPEEEQEVPDKAGEDIKQEEKTSDQVQPEEEKPEEKEEQQEKEEESGLIEKAAEEEESKTELQKMLEPEPESDSEGEGKFALLARLFKFIRAQEKPLNPVLSGYFAKLVTLLINRKQKQIVPYIFQENPDIIDCLVYHVYQKSISELLNKFLNIMVHDFEDTSLSMKIQEKQREVINNLIDKLGPDCEDEDNLNASTILQDMLEIKDFYNQVCEKENIQKLLDMVFDKQNKQNQQSQISSITVLNLVIQYFHDKYQKNSNQRNRDSQDDDDDMNMGGASDNEDDNAENPVLDLLKESIQNLPELLTKSEPKVLLENSYNTQATVPLGHLRLKIVEMIHLLLKLKKPQIQGVLQNSEIFSQITLLIKQYPWNNFLQLKVQAIYDEVFENQPEEVRQSVLRKCNLIPLLVELQATPQFKHESERTIRQGYMAAVIKLANIVQKHKDKEEVRNYIDECGQESWSSFVDGELKSSNTLNTRSLGGQQPRGNVDDEDDNSSYETNMEKIMARFANFSQMSQDSNDDEEAKEEINQDEDNQQEDDFTRDGQGESPEKKDKDITDLIQPVEEEKLKEAPLDQEYMDNTYWHNVSISSYEDVDELMKEYEF